MTQKTQRPSADKTRERILEAAKQLFLEKGFDGASMSAIAKSAGVNKALLFHHFGDKANLWCEVKADVSASTQAHVEYDMATAGGFFESLLDDRFNAYENHPELARLMAWQHVVKEGDAIVGNEYTSPERWKKALKALARRGELRAGVDIDLVMLFIAYSCYAPFLQTHIQLSRAQKQAYKQLILNCCLAEFTEGKKS